MADRRHLVEGLKSKLPPVDPQLENQFVYGSEHKGTDVKPPVAVHPVSMPATSNRSPFSTRLRSDFAAALKRASLERQLNDQEPSSVQEILEQALESWLRSNGYL